MHDLSEKPGRRSAPEDSDVSIEEKAAEWRRRYYALAADHQQSRADEKKVLTLLVATLIVQQGHRLPTRSSERARFSIDPRALDAANDGFNLPEWEVEQARDYTTGALTFTLRPVFGGFAPLMDERRLFRAPHSEGGPP